MKQQKDNSHLLEHKQSFDNVGTGWEYVADDNRLLWYAPSGFFLGLAIPRSLVPGILALFHTTYGYRGVARTTELVQRNSHWTSLKRDVQDYVLACGCQRIKRSTSQRVAMLPARFLKFWDVLKIDIQDMGATPKAGDKYLLVVVDRASKFLFAHSIPNKTAENVAKTLLEFLLIFGIPLSLRNDPGTELTADIAQDLRKLLNMTIDYGPLDHPRAQETVESLGGWIH